MKRMFLILLLALGTWFAGAQTPDDQYVYIYNLIQSGDSLEQGKQIAAALDKYKEALDTLTRFRKGYPDWSPIVVKYRVAYLEGKISSLQPKVMESPVTGPAGPPSTAAPGVVGTSELQTQVNALQAQIRILAAEKSSLEAKLKEALTLQPAAVDPRELARAQEQIRSLQKDNELLKATQEKARTGVEQGKQIEELKSELAEANRRAASETKRLEALTKERDSLAAKLDKMAPNRFNDSSIQETRNDLTRANRELEQLKQSSAEWQKERRDLQAKIAALTKEVQSLPGLKSENEALKQQVTSMKKGARGNVAELNVQLAEVRRQMAALEQEKEILRLEKIALSERVKSLQATQPSAAIPAPFSSQEARRIAELEKEKQDLTRKLEAANQKADARSARKASAGKVSDLEAEVAALRGRLAALEAKAVPYTAEELALFRSEPVGPPVGGADPGRSPANVALMAKAQREFAAGEFAKAESSYREVLQQDKSNLAGLGNLAAAQLQQGKAEDAERTLEAALKLDPQDVFSLSTMGLARFQQRKFDAAFDVLNRAAALAPQDAVIQNRLGMVLSEKGQRSAAETAFRKAIQLQPNYAEAHHNLAVVYATQKPPMLELARWHYRKALTAGQPKNTELEKMLGGRQLDTAQRRRTGVRPPFNGWSRPPMSEAIIDLV